MPKHSIAFHRRLIFLIIYKELNLGYSNEVKSVNHYRPVSCYTGGLLCYSIGMSDIENKLWILGIADKSTLENTQSEDLAHRISRADDNVLFPKAMKHQ